MAQAQAQEVYLFQPTQIASCILWLDAADSTVFTGSSWTDKSGTANNAVNPNPGTTNMPSITTWTNGRRAAGFSIANNNAIRTTNNIPATTVTYFMVLRIRAVSGYSIFFLNNVDGQRQMNVNTSSFPANINVTYNSSLAVAVPLSVTQNQPFLLCSTADTSTLSLFANGAITASATQNPINTSSASQNYFGAGNGPGPYTDCDFAEILIYNSVLSTTNRQQIEGYLAWKWNLQGSLPSNHPFKNNPPYTQSNFPLINPPRPPIDIDSSPSFSPTQISGCALWLDAADTTTITTTGATLNSWRDKIASISFVPTNGTGITYSGGLINLASSTFLKNAASAISIAQSFTLFLIASNSTGLQGAAVYISPLDGGQPGIYVEWPTPTNYRFLYRTPPGIGSGTSVFIPAPGILPLTIGTMYRLPSGGNYDLGMAINGGSPTVVSDTQVSGDLGNCTELAFGVNYNTGAQGRFLTGSYAEIIVYTTQLSVAQQQQVEGYLAWKWNLQANLPSDHPYKAFYPFPFSLVPTVPIRNSNRFWQPTQYSGCHLWLDAADRNTLTINGINVSQWRDKSTNAFVFNGSSGTFPTYGSSLNGLPVISSATGQKLTTTNWSQSFTTPTLFFLIRPTQNITTDFQSYSIFRGVTGTGTIQLDITYFNEAPYYYFLQVWTNTASFILQATLNNSSLFNPTNLPLLMTAVANGITNQNIGRYNARNLATPLNDPNTFLTVSGATLDLIGASDARGFDTCEVIVYNRVLSFQEYTQVEGYLAWKWGTQGSLPSNHPFKLFPPSP